MPHDTAVRPLPDPMPAERTAAERFLGTRAVAPQHAFDAGVLLRWLREHAAPFADLRADEPIRIEQFRGGQSNPTYLLNVRDRRYVLRRKPPGVLLPSAHAVDREYRVISALARFDVPVARTHVLCEDPAVVGTPFYVMDYVPGRVFWDPRLPHADAQERRAIYGELNRVIGALHAVDPMDAGLADYGRAGDYLARQIDRWTRQYRAAETETIDAVEHLVAWLPAHRPARDEVRVVHGDFRLDNVIFDPVAPRIVAVLDWELSTLGDPIADFAYHCMTWRMTPGGSRGLAGCDFASLGIPDERAYVASYFARTGRAPLPAREWEYYMVFSMFRLVGILQGVLKRALQGNASSEEALAIGRRARPLAQQAWACARSIGAR